jgi:predicted transcriptional regulator
MKTDTPSVPVKRVSQEIIQCIMVGLTLRDYAVIQAIVRNRETPMTRQDIEESTGLDKSVVSRSTERLVRMKLITRDKKHEIGGSKRRAAKYFLA